MAVEGHEHSHCNGWPIYHKPEASCSIPVPTSTCSWLVTCGSMKRWSRFRTTKSCMALVTLSPRRHRSTSSFWKASSSSSHFPGKGSLQSN